MGGGVTGSALFDGSENVSISNTFVGTLPVSNGGTGMNTVKDALENLLGLSKLTTYYNTESTEIADTILDGVFLINNNKVGIPEFTNNYVYIIQLFYSDVSVTANRVQIAIGYSTQSMYIRNYRINIPDGWNDWRRINIAPTELSTVGKWQYLNVATLPSSGTWAYFLIGINSSGNIDGGAGGIASGGTTVLSGKTSYLGFCYRCG